MLSDIYDALKGIAHSVAKLPETIRGAISGVVNTIASVVSKIAEGVKAIAGFLGNVITTILKWVELAAIKIWNFVKNIFSKIKHMLEEFADWLYHAIWNVASGLAEDLMTILTIVSEKLSGLAARSINTGINTLGDIIAVDMAIFGVKSGLETIMHAKDGKDWRNGLLKLIGVPIVGAIAGDLLRHIVLSHQSIQPLGAMDFNNALVPAGESWFSTAWEPPTKSFIVEFDEATFVWAETDAVVTPITVPTTTLIVADEFIGVESSAEVIAIESRVTPIEVEDSISVESSALVSTIGTKTISVVDEVGVNSSASVSAYNPQEVKQITAVDEVSVSSSASVNAVTVQPSPPSPTTKSIYASTSVNVSSSASVNAVTVQPPQPTTKSVYASTSVDVSSSASVSATTVQPSPSPTITPTEGGGGSAGKTNPDESLPSTPPAEST